jgi:hypothetical protein
MATMNMAPLAVISADAARQGVTGHNVRYVLGFGIAGVVMSFAPIGLLSAYGILGPLE